jgi:plastocyanin
MRKAVLCVVVAALTVGAACGSSKSSSSAKTLKIQVDGTTDKFNGAFLKYFPNSVSARPGDTIDFAETWTGEPHTVTMGTLVETGLKAAQAAGPNAQTPPPDYAKLPGLLPQGPGDFNQNAAQPCFLATGAPPTDGATACPKADQTQPAFNGKQAYYNSGFLAEGSTFRVKLAPDTAPGSYHFYCNLHGPDMSGTIVVKAKDASVPDQAQVDKDATTQLNDLVNKVVPAYNDAKAGKFPLPGVTNVAGYGSQDVQAVLINEFIPAQIQAKVGQKVSWTVIGPHTLSFGKAPIEPGKFATKSPDGAWHLNAAAFGPSGFPPPPPPPSGPPPTGVSVTPINGGTWDGTGFKSTGVLASFPPALYGVSLSFTKAGTYPYVCLIHPKMGGVVTVS